MEEEKIHFAAPEKKPFAFFSKKKAWLNILLFVLTIASTFFVGISLSVNYKYAEAIIQNNHFSIEPETFLDPQIIFLSLIYVTALLGILLGHEFGHFFTCRYYGIEATLPYFIPAPTLIGTMGAFIKIKSPITRKQQLFDIGVAGPLTGFVLSVPTLIYGLSLSKIVPAVPQGTTLTFGEPLLLKIVGGMIFKGIPANSDVILHPVAFAAWVGILVTALNLFPIGQLDGGHIFYALIGSKSRNYSRFVLIGFVIMGIFFWVGWFVWALLISVLGLKHPRIMDEAIPLSPRRKFIGVLILLIFILSFIPDPLKGYNLFNLTKHFSF